MRGISLASTASMVWRARLLLAYVSSLQVRNFAKPTQLTPHPSTGNVIVGTTHYRHTNT